MKKNIIYLAGMLAISLACACTKGTDVTPVAAATDSFTVNGATYSVDRKNVTLDSIAGKPLTTYKIVLIHGAVTSAKPTGDYSLVVDSVSTQATSGTFSFHTAISTLYTLPTFGAIYYDNVTGAKTTFYETLNTASGSMTKTGARSFTMTATATNIFASTTTAQNTALISAVVTSF
jgi:2-keto-4-pentenoate hydratase